MADTVRFIEFTFRPRTAACTAALRNHSNCAECTIETLACAADSGYSQSLDAARAAV
jgi:hypothetical protein